MHVYKKKYITVIYCNLYCGEKGIGHDTHCNKFKDKYKSCLTAIRLPREVSPNKEN